jgi:hypothetical protein
LPLVVLVAAAGWNWVQEAQHAGETNDWVYLVPGVLLFAGLFLIAAGICGDRDRRPEVIGGASSRAMASLGRAVGARRR